MVAVEVDVAALYEAHWRQMLRLACLLTGDRSLAEDVVQDAFLALHRKQTSLRDPAAAVAYVRAAVTNLSRMTIRRKVADRRLARFSEPEGAPPDQQLLLDGDHREVMAALRSLPRRQQEVLVLRYWMNLSEADIAATLGISRGTVKSTASRGMDALERTLRQVTR